tara:strand:+ start:5790 stop:6053 length:264 start_codon:yes stop_codon:yes gene_type:complete
MVRYTKKVIKKMGFITQLQVDHVLEFGTVVPGHVKTTGGSLRLLGQKTNRGVLKKFEFTDEIVLVRYVTKDYTLIIDVYKHNRALKC